MHHTQGAESKNEYQSACTIEKQEYTTLTKLCYITSQLLHMTQVRLKFIQLL